MAKISYFDLACVIIFFSLAFSVYKRGFVKEIFVRFAWIIATLISFTFTSSVGMNITKRLTNIQFKPLGYLISFVFVFVISYVIIKIIASFIDTVAELPILNELNKALGIILGLLEASIIIAIIIELLLLQNFFPPEKWLENSKIAPFFMQYILLITLTPFSLGI